MGPPRAPEEATRGDGRMEHGAGADTPAAAVFPVSSDDGGGEVPWTSPPAPPPPRGTAKRGDEEDASDEQVSPAIIEAPVDGNDGGRGGRGDVGARLTTDRPILVGDGGATNDGAGSKPTTTRRRTKRATSAPPSEAAPEGSPTPPPATEEIQEGAFKRKRKRPGVALGVGPGDGKEERKEHVWERMMHVGENTFNFIAIDARHLDGLGGQLKNGRSVHLEVEALGWFSTAPQEALPLNIATSGYESPVHHMLVWALKEQTLKDMDELAERWLASVQGSERSTDAIKFWQLTPDQSSFEVFGDTSWQVVVCMIHYNKHLTREEVLADARKTGLGCKYRLTGKRTQETPSTLVHADISFDEPIESGLDYVRVWRYNDTDAVAARGGGGGKDGGRKVAEPSPRRAAAGKETPFLGRVMRHQDFNFHTHLFANVSSLVIISPEVFAAACRGTTGVDFGEEGNAGSSRSGDVLTEAEAKACVSSGDISRVIEEASRYRSTQRCEGIYESYNDTTLGVAVMYDPFMDVDMDGESGGEQARGNEPTTRAVDGDLISPNGDYTVSGPARPGTINRHLVSGQTYTAAKCWARGGGNGDESYFSDAEPDFISADYDTASMGRNGGRRGPHHFTLRYGDYVLLRCRYNVPPAKRGQIRFGQTSKDEMCNIRFPLETHAVSRLSQIELLEEVAKSVSSPSHSPSSSSSSSSRGTTARA